MNESDVTLFVDTAGSREGYFAWPPPEGSVFVEVDGAYGEILTCVHARYTAPWNLAEAIALAIDLYHEIEGSDIWHQMGVRVGPIWYRARVNGVSYRAELTDDLDWHVAVEE